MNWQDYQEAVGLLYEQLAEMGTVTKNLFLPDKITGQKRQVDAWWEIDIDEHKIRILIDSKMRSSKLDVKDVEEIVMLAESVGADKAIIVTNSEWTRPALKSAEFKNVDLRVFSFDEATDLLVPEKWCMCTVCEEDCVIMDISEVFGDRDGMWKFFYGGRCRSCSAVLMFCSDCGTQGVITAGRAWICGCDMTWKIEVDKLKVYYNNGSENVDGSTQLNFDF